MYVFCVRFTSEGVVITFSFVVTDTFCQGSELVQTILMHEPCGALLGNKYSEGVHQFMGIC